MVTVDKDLPLRVEYLNLPGGYTYNVTVSTLNMHGAGGVSSRLFSTQRYIPGKGKFLLCVLAGTSANAIAI